MSRRNLLRPTVAAAAAVLGLTLPLVASCRSASVAPAVLPSPPALPALVADALVPSPAIRIGVSTEAPRVSLGADSGLIVDGVTAKGERVRASVQRATFVAAAAEGAAVARLVETGAELSFATVVPEKRDEGAFVDATPYRGVFEVRAASASALTVVNVLNLEDYLRGVVPNELSPAAFPELEALKAQAVAARTYALRNMGQFRARGYDLCATPSCQVYRGRSTEHPLTDQAITETEGVAISHAGGLINALYTSTCGGHTEDGGNIFDGEPVPYLKGVACAPERGSWGRIKTLAPRSALDSEDRIGLDVALLQALAVVTRPQPFDAAWLRGAATEADVRGWTERLLAALRRQGCESRVDPPLARRASFFQHLVGVACWEERARRLLGPGDTEYLVQVEDGASLHSGERAAAAILLREGVLAPFADNTLRPGNVISRGQALRLMARLALKIGPPGLQGAEFLSYEGDRLRVRVGETEEEHTLDPALRLVRTLGDNRAAASEVSVAPSDQLRFVARAGRIVYLEVEQPTQGVASDRGSRYSSWELRLTPEQVAIGVGRYGNVGRVRDLIPRRIGVSGRVVDLSVLGSDGELLLSGLRVRWGLGLRENLFVVDRELAADGSVARFVFTGRGWGHGVGLCQVGAYGMAHAGATYAQILGHYYSSVQLGRRR
ncbi:MAG: SpoIID/LytB domain-containing protein [Vicinamibacteria bacterium]